MQDLPHGERYPDAANIPKLSKHLYGGDIGTSKPFQQSTAHRPYDLHTQSRIGLASLNCAGTAQPASSRSQPQPPPPCSVRACPPNQCSTWPPCSLSMSCSPMNAIMSGEVQYVSMSSTLHCVLRSHELALCQARAKPECPGCAWLSCHHTLHDRSRQTHPRRVLGLCNLPKYVAIWAPYFMYIRIDTYTCKDIFICLWNLTLNPKDILTYINA